MSGKIGEELLVKLEAVLASDPQHKIPIIVTLNPGADISILDNKGMDIQRVIESVSAFAGVLSASEIEEISLLEEVNLIEYDGTVYGLSED